MDKAVSYLRVSSREQAQGYSLEAQRDEILQYAKKKNIEIIEEFEDRETAKQSGRKSFTRMVSFLKKNKSVNILLVEKTDRLYRNMPDRVTISEIDELVIHLVKENEILSEDSTSHKKFIHDIKLVIGKNYIDNLKEEIKKGMKKKLESGGLPGTAPFGYVNNRATREIDLNPPFSDHVKQFYDWYSSGRYSVNDVATKAKEQMIINPKTKKPFRQNQIHRILTNPLYCGIVKWKGETYQGKHTPIVTVSQWEKVQQILKGKNLSNKTKRDFPFIGLLTCPKCGCAVTAEIKKQKYVYYHCTKFNGKDSCDNDYIRQEKIDNAMATLVKTVQLPADIADWMLANFQRELKNMNKSQTQQQRVIKGKITKLQNLMEKAYVDKLEGNISEEFWQQNHQSWQEQMIHLKSISANDTDPAMLINTAERTIELARSVYSQYVTEDWANKRKILKKLLSNCTYYRGNLDAVYVKPFDIFAKGNENGEWWRRWEPNYDLKL